jgi:hypothetical protein
MKKTVLIICGTGILFCICVGVMLLPVLLHIHAPARNANCLPIRYSDTPSGYLSTPNDIQPYVPNISRVKTPINKVKEFYDEKLLSQANEQKGQWDVREVRNGEFLYHCTAILNSEEAERGCIYIREREGNTIIETIWLFSATAAPACEWYMSELPYGSR